MRRTVTLAALWLVAAVVAVFVASRGVAVVGDQVTDARPASLAAADIEQRLADAATSTTTTTATTSATTVPPTTAPGTPDTSATTAPVETASASVTRTYRLVGGTASLRFTPSGVEVVFANPAPGFTVEIEPEHGNGVKVEFESGTHESRVAGWWDGGPVDDVEERPDG